MKRSQPRRDWTVANEKRGPCSVCGEGPTELAHIWGREADKFYAVDEDFGMHSRVVHRHSPAYVSPLRVVPLCKMHHDEYDAHDLDLLPYLTPEEQAQAVLDAGGIENARIRTAPLAYASKVASHG